MSPQTLLDHIDSGRLWPAPLSARPGYDLAAAQADALQVHRLRLARGERVRGYKVGFTNRGIWPIYNVFAPIWGFVWDTTLSHDNGEGVLALGTACQPRLEPEAVFGLRATPPAGATLQGLFDALEWVAPGFEVVQSHLPDWRFQAADTVADGGLHARLRVGTPVPVRAVAADAPALDALLAGAGVQLQCDGLTVDQGRGAAVLDSPLRALLHFVQTLRACPGAPDLKAGDVVTTGTWTNAWPVAPGQVWCAQFDAPLGRLVVRLE